MTKPLSILTLCLCATFARAANVHVGTTAALTNSVAAAASNDTVWCSNGNYQVYNAEVTDGLVVPAGVTVRSVSGNPADVSFDGQASCRAVTLAASSWLIGVTVSNGNLNEFGAGVYGGSVSNCVITKNVNTYIRRSEKLG